MGMLILARNTHDRITIGEPGKTTTFTGEITITVVGNSRGVVRLGFDAPRQVGIYRDNIVRKKVSDDAETPHTPHTQLRGDGSGETDKRTYISGNGD